MNKFELSPAFIIGHEKIDSDHVELINILNEMIDGFVAEDLEYCQKKWQQFCVSLEQHFIDETEIMDDFGYIPLDHDDDHEQDHQKILISVAAMAKKFSTLDDWEIGLFEVRNDLLTFILKHDLKFAEYLITIGYNNARR